MPTRTLTIVSGDSAGTSVEVAGEIVVGREGADLSLPDEQISRRHAVVRSVEDGIEVEDLGSLNGTFVDGRRLEAPVTVRSAAALRVGTTELSLVVEAPQAEAASAATLSRDVPPAPDVTRARDIPAPDVTRARDIPAPDVTPADDIPDLESTRAREIPVQQVTRARVTPTDDIPDLESTRAREIPVQQVTRARVTPADDIPDLESTRAREIPVQQVTRARGTAGAPAGDQGEPAGGRPPPLLLAAAVAVAVAIVLLVLLAL